jgi:hypothetical protein
MKTSEMTMPVDTLAPTPRATLANKKLQLTRETIRVLSGLKAGKGCAVTVTQETGATTWG